MLPIFCGFDNLYIIFCLWLHRSVLVLMQKSSESYSFEKSLRQRENRSFVNHTTTLSKSEISLNRKDSLSHRSTAVSFPSPDGTCFQVCCRPGPSCWRSYPPARTSPACRNSDTRRAWRWSSPHSGRPRRDSGRELKPGSNAQRACGCRRQLRKGRGRCFAKEGR